MKALSLFNVLKYLIGELIEIHSPLCCNLWHTFARQWTNDRRQFITRYLGHLWEEPTMTLATRELKFPALSNWLLFITWSETLPIQLLGKRLQSLLESEESYGCHLREGGMHLNFSNSWLRCFCPKAYLFPVCFKLEFSFWTTKKMPFILSDQLWIFFSKRNISREQGVKSVYSHNFDLN